jgi:predicted MFS family arabinose efflux permease
MRTVCGVLLTFGMAFGVVQVAVPAFTLARGSASAGGVLLASLSLGSLVGGVVYGARRWPGALPRRLAAVMLGLGTGYALLALPADYVPLAVLLVLAGTLLAPATVICSTLLDTVAPPGTVTEAFAVMVTAIVAGVAVGNALGGSVVESASYDVAVLAAGAIAACGAGLVVARRRTLSATSATTAGTAR